MIISQFDKDVCALSFQKINGALMNYYNKVKMIKEEYLNPLSEHYKLKEEDDEDKEKEEGEEEEEEVEEEEEEEEDDEEKEEKDE